MSATLPRLLAVAALAACAAAPAAQARPHHAGARDADHDGLSARYERLAHTNPHRADSDRDGISDAREDYDRDGVDNGTEQLARTNPAKRDSNRNHVPDGREDPDRDHMNNRAESTFRMNPRKADTDGDGIRDGAENAGWIRGVAGQLVTIRLAAGGSLTALLEDPADLSCDTGADDLAAGVEDAADLPDALGGVDPQDTPDDTAATDDATADDATADDSTADDATTVDDPADAPDSAGPDAAAPAATDACVASLTPGRLVAEAEIDRSGVQPAITWLALLP